MTNNPVKKRPAWFDALFIIAAFVLLSIATGEIYYRIILEDRIEARVTAVVTRALQK